MAYESLDRISTEEKRLKGEEERLSLETSHFEREEESLSSELRVTEEAISQELAGELQGKKVEVETSIDAVQAEIKSLENQLRTKRLEW